MKIRFEQKTLFCLPWTQTILGTQLHGTANFMALDWLTRVNVNPALLGICVNKHHASHEAIVQTGEYSVNVPSTAMMETTDYTGLVSAKRVDKSDLFSIFYGELLAAPMIADCPITIECKVYQPVDLPTHTFFIAEMVNIYSEERFMTDKHLDMAKIDPFLLTMPDNRYWSLGEPIGKAWNIGKKLMRQS